MNIIVTWLVKSLLGFLGKELLRILNDKKVQKLAIEAVEFAASMDLDNDGKRVAAAAELKANAASLGIELRDSYIAMMVEAAVARVKGKAERR